MAKLKDVVAVTGKYEKDGQTKAKYTNCGALIEANGKQFIVLEVIPAPVVGKDGVPKWFLNLYDPQEEKKAEKPKSSKSDFNDDVPF